ncbi:MAG: hypothetical protein HY784_04365, partial [Chloroflexi bacterium]|nr:hypothetical protein [Chloroflexota bacterium]
EASRAEQQVLLDHARYREWTIANTRAEDAAAAARAADLLGHPEPVADLQAESARWGTVRAGLEAINPALAGGEYDLHAIRYREQTYRAGYLAAERQNAAAREASDWSSKGDAYVTTLTSLAAALLLLGLSLTVHSRLRVGFVGVGLLIVFASVVRVALVLVTPVHTTPPEAMEHFADGLVAQREADTLDAAQQAPERNEAVEAFTAAIALDRRYADAYFARAQTRSRPRLAGADPNVAVLAAADYTRGIELGSENSVALTNLGWALYLQGDEEGSIRASQRAIALNSQECVAHLNLGLALLAAGRGGEAGPAYDEAAACITTQLPDQQDWLAQAAVTDLKDLLAAHPEALDVDRTLRRFQQAAASRQLFGALDPRPTGAALTGLSVAGAVDVDGLPLGAVDSFAPGTSHVYVILDFAGASPDTAWLVYLYRDGALVNNYSSQTWDQGESGRTWVRFGDTPFPAGRYTAEVYFNGNYIRVVAFDVQPGPALDTVEYHASAFNVVLDPPADWVVAEEPGEGGFLVGQHPTGEQLFFAYFTVAYNGSASEVVEGVRATWAADYPDLAVDDSGDFILGGLPDAAWEWVAYWEQGTPMRMLITGAVDRAGMAHILLLHVPAADADRAYAEVFEPLLRSLHITP